MESFRIELDAKSVEAIGGGAWGCAELRSAFARSSGRTGGQAPPVENWCCFNMPRLLKYFNVSRPRTKIIVLFSMLSRKKEEHPRSFSRISQSPYSASSTKGAPTWGSHSASTPIRVGKRQRCRRGLSFHYMEVPQSFDCTLITSPINDVARY